MDPNELREVLTIRDDDDTRICDLIRHTACVVKRMREQDSMLRAAHEALEQQSRRLDDQAAREMGRMG